MLAYGKALLSLLSTQKYFCCAIRLEAGWVQDFPGEKLGGFMAVIVFNQILIVILTGAFYFKTLEWLMFDIDLFPSWCGSCWVEPFSFKIPNQLVSESTDYP